MRTAARTTAVWREPAGWVLAFGDPHFCKLRRTALPSWEQAMAWQAELVRRERRMHCLAGLVRGRADTCTGKVDHLSGLAAEDYVRHAPVLPVEPYLRAEPYPCVWCNGWHVDRALEAGERAFYGGLGVVWQVRDVARQELWETAEPERRELLHRLMTLAMLVIGRHVPGFPLEEWLAFV
jgi:hypothetical protein